MELPLPILLGLCTIFSWGIADFFIVLAVKRQSSYTALLLSQVIALGLFLIYILFQGSFVPIGGGMLFVLLITGILNVIAYASFYEGLSKAPVALISPLAACAAVVTVLIGITLLGESVTALQSTGIILAISGAALTSINMAELRAVKKVVLRQGALYGFVALLSWGIVFALFDVLVEGIGWAQAQLYLKMMVVALLFAYVGLRGFSSFPSKAQGSFFLFILIVGALDVLGGGAYAKSVTLEHTSIMFSLISAFPVVTIILARLFLKEKVGVIQYLGAAVALIGVVILSL